MEMPQECDVDDIFRVFLLLALNRFHTLFFCFHWGLGTSNCQLGNVTLGIVHTPHTETQYWVLYHSSYYLIYARCFSKVWFFVWRSTERAEASSDSQTKHKKIVLALFKVYNEDIEMASFTSFCCSHYWLGIKMVSVLLFLWYNVVAYSQLNKNCLL